MDERQINPIANLDEVETHDEDLPARHWGASYKILSPTMRSRGGRLGLVQNTLGPGRAGGPFHSHRLEDEVFFIQSGRGILRYGDQVFELRPGDCVSCPAATEYAHQIANPFDEDLVYLALGDYHPEEVCVYPDSHKVMVRSLKKVGLFEKTDYMHGEAEVPQILSMSPDRRS